MMRHGHEVMAGSGAAEMKLVRRVTHLSRNDEACSAENSNVSLRLSSSAFLAYRQTVSCSPFVMMQWGMEQILFMKLFSLRYSDDGIGNVHLA